MTLRLLDDAREEMRQSARWYEEKRSGLGDEFLDEVHAAFEEIEVHPKRFKKVEMEDSDREIRRFIVKRFPFLVVYEVRAEEVLIVAVAHGKRKPHYWRDRA